MLAGLLPLGGCSDSTTGSTYGSGDKRNDPALKACRRKNWRNLQVEGGTRSREIRLGGSGGLEHVVVIRAPLGKHGPAFRAGRDGVTEEVGPMGLRVALRLQSD